MPQYGSSQNLISTNLSQTVDNQGNPVISADTGFGASPLGYAARAQALFGLPNSTFELTPPDTTAVISAANPLPYWDVQDYSAAVMSGSAVYDSTTNSWGVKLDPGTAAANDYITMTTRSYLINDDNLSLRQQALVVVSKNGTYAGTTQWNLKLTASYYDSTDTLLQSGTVATIYDNATWTSMAGTTTTGGSAINAAAHYVDLTFTLTATAAVTSATSVTIKSCLLQTSSGAGGKSFVVTETFTSSGTFNVPTGITSLLAVIAYGGGGGGGGGAITWAPTGSFGTGGAGGGGGSRLAILRDLSLGTATSVSVGIGAGGAGGGGAVYQRTSTGTASVGTNGTAGASGGATTFGAYLSVPGGGGGNPGGTGNVDQGGNGGTVAGAATATALGVVEYLGGTGGKGGAVGTASNGAVGAGEAGGTAATRGMSSVFYLTNFGTIGSAGGSASGTGGTIVLGTPGTPSAGTNYLIEGGGGSGGTNTTASPDTVGASSGGGAGGGGGGASMAVTTAGTTTPIAGNGGNAGANSGAGGGAGGVIKVDTSSTAGQSSSKGTATAGNGGSGGSGLVTVAWIG